MTEKNLVPLENEDRRAARRSRRERRQLALAERQQTSLVEQDPDQDPEAEGEVAPPTVSRRREPTLHADAFILPPRAQLTKSSSNFARFMKGTFFLVVALPTVFAALFYAFVASDQYATFSSFAVRGSSTSTASMDLGGLFALGGGVSDPEVSDSFILQQYVDSREMVEILVNEANFLEVYSRQSADAYYRLDPKATIEQLVDYWRTMTDVEYDTETGIISLVVRAFRPSDAEAITRKVIEKSEALVNDLSMRSREDSVKNAQRELKLSEARYSETRKAVAAYRGNEQEIDPTATATTRQTLVGTLEGAVAQLESQLTSLRATMSDNSPRVVYVRNQLDALRRQIGTEKLRVAVAEEGSDQPVLTERLSRYEELLAEREFGEKAYLSSLATLEAARADALKQQRYLAVFVRGSAPEEAEYPDGLRWTAILFGTLFLTWGVFAMIAAAIRDRVV